MVRQPVVSGMFYESDPNKLREQIISSFKSKLGPGMPSGKKEKNIFGAVVPHAGYMFSGPCAAHVYKELAESKEPDLYIILGTNHCGFGNTTLSTETWQTPLGEIKVDKVFAHKLMQICKIKDNKLAHAKEHSIEVQLPFLQYINDDFKFLPIIVSRDYILKDLARAIRKAALSLNKEICVIASSDFTHYGTNYDYIPFESDIKKNMYKLDNDAINAIINADNTAFQKHLEKTGSTVCGHLPITVLLELVKLYKTKGKLLKYYTSGDIMNEYETAVGYASITFQ